MKRIATLLAGVALTTSVVAQTRQVSGLVQDAAGKPVEGASVQVKGTTVGTTTGADGRFTLNVPANGRTLVISSLNFATFEQSIGNNSSFTVNLQPASTNVMDEVVVVGYGTQRRRELTGTVASVSGSKIKDNPVQSFDQALSGRAAGVNVNLPNGALNNPPVIRVRGVNSISLSSFPLVVIDGVPTFTGNIGGTASNNPLADINPGDIESMDVLKDAAATAIYGSRAAAGVLVITTKKGRAGRARVSYDGWAGQTKAFRLIDMFNGQQYTDLKNEGLVNNNTPPNGTTRGFYTQLGPDGQVVSTNWYDLIYRTGNSSNHNVSVSGANEGTSYFLSGGYSKQQGMLRNNDFNRLSLRANIDHKVFSWFTVGGNLAYTNSLNTAPNTGSLPGQTFSIAGLGRLPLVLAPNVSPYNADGSYNINAAANTIGQGANRTALSFYNPAYILDQNRFSSQNDRLLGNVSGAITPLKGLTFRTVYGIDYITNTNKEFRAALHGDGVQFGGAAQNTAQALRRWNWQNTLQYDRSFGDHNLGLLAGNEQQYTYTESWGADRRGQSDVFYDEYQGGYNSIVAAGNFLAENYLVSFFGRLSYNYKRKYIISANVRRDGYSAFGAGNQYGNFAGGGAAWVLSEEDFFKNSGVGKTISNLKFKASYGRVGNNQGINDYAARSLFGSGLYGAEPTLFYGVAANRDLRWETSTKTDLGMEIGFLNNRFTAEFTYYKNVVDDMILAAPQAPSRGIPGNSILTNVGKMTNTGFEVQLNAAIVQGKDFQWNSSFNIGTVKNVVNELAAGNADIFPDIQAGITERPSIIRVGESIGSFYAVPTVGVNPDNGRRLFQLRDGTVVQYNHAAIAAGQPAWTKLDGTPAPRVPDQGRDGVIIGPALPKFSGGFDNTFRYKGFDLNVLFFFSGGNYIYNGTKAGLRDQRNWNNSTEVLNRWQKAGDVTSIPRLVFGDNISNGSGLVISENVEKGDFIKARNVAFGYTIPRSLMQRINFSSARLYVSAQNLFTITNYSGFDPEVSTTGNANGNPSVDRNVVPQARTITFGINIGF